MVLVVARERQLRDCLREIASGMIVISMTTVIATIIAMPALVVRAVGPGPEAAV